MIRTDNESDNITNLQFVSIEIILSVRSIAQASALKMEVSIGRRFLIIFSDLLLHFQFS